MFGGSMKRNLLIPILACAPFALANSPITVSGNLPDAVIGSSYGAMQLGPGSFHKQSDPQLQASGGQAPYHFVLAGGSLPTGISLNSDGTITGITFSIGTFNFVVVATDSLSNQGSASF